MAGSHSNSLSKLSKSLPLLFKSTILEKYLKVREFELDLSSFESFDRQCRVQKRHAKKCVENSQPFWWEPIRPRIAIYEYHYNEIGVL